MRRRAGRNAWTRGLARAVIVTLLLPGSSLRSEGSAQTPDSSGIRHVAPDCVLAGEHAKLTACFDSVVARSRLVFRGGGISNYYRIDMAPDDLKHGCVNGFLPKLKRREARTHEGNAIVQYYIESTQRDLMSARTKLQDLQIVASAAECKGTLAPSVPEVDVDPMPVDPKDPPYSQVAMGSHWESGPGDERSSAEPSASAEVTEGGGAAKGILLIAGGAALVAAVAIAATEAASSANGGNGSGDGGGSGSCSSNSQCSAIGIGRGADFCGSFSGDPQGASNVRCASDGLCHCCYTFNNRCQSCSSTNPCVDRNTSCVSGVCVFNRGARP